LPTLVVVPDFRIETERFERGARFVAGIEDHRRGGSPMG
jgi:hypothetical protein